MANEAPNPPDFDLMRESLVNFTNETFKIQNVVGVEANTNILAALQRIEERQIAFEQRQIAFEQRQIAFEQRQVALETSIRASKRNAIARLQNSHLRARDAALAPMFSLSTNSRIAELPSTPEDIGTITNRNLAILLQELDLDASGNISAKRARIRAYIGLTAEAV